MACHCMPFASAVCVFRGPLKFGDALPDVPPEDWKIILLVGSQIGCSYAYNVSAFHKLIAPQQVHVMFGVVPSEKVPPTIMENGGAPDPELPSVVDVFVPVPFTPTR